jgi:hypothetical protein
MRDPRAVEAYGHVGTNEFTPAHANKALAAVTEGKSTKALILPRV